MLKSLTISLFVLGSSLNFNGSAIAHEGCHHPESKEHFTNAQRLANFFLVTIRTFFDDVITPEMESRVVLSDRHIFASPDVEQIRANLHNHYAWSLQGIFDRAIAAMILKQDLLHTSLLTQGILTERLMSLGSFALSYPEETAFFYFLSNRLAHKTADLVIETKLTPEKNWAQELYGLGIKFGKLVEEELEKPEHKEIADRLFKACDLSWYSPMLFKP